MLSRPARLAACLAVLAAASGCAVIDPNGIVTRNFSPAGQPAHVPVPSPAGSLDAATRQEAFDFVWQTIADRYYDPKLNGVDWKAAGERWRPRVLGASDDKAFWDLLDRMTGELRDAHTRVESPQRAEQIERQQVVSLGFGFRLLGDRLVVVSVNPESEAWWAGVRPGMTIEQVEGEPARAAYGKLLAESRDSSTDHAKHVAASRRLVGGDPDSTASLVFARGDGTPLAAKLKRTRLANPPRVTHRRLPSGFGYVRLTAWSQNLQGAMIAAIAAHKDAPGLVIDLRGNPGGSGLMVRNVASQFFPKDDERVLGKTLTRTGKPITLAFVDVIKLEQKIEGTGLHDGPVVVLVNRDSGSASEMFSAAMQSQKRATIVGETTCGCLLGYMGYATVPGGGKLAYSEMGFLFPDGQRVEGKGVVPDKAVDIAVPDLVAQRDRALETAEAILAAAPKPAPKKVAGGQAR